MTGRPGEDRLLLAVAAAAVAMLTATSTVLWAAADGQFTDPAGSRLGVVAGGLRGPATSCAVPPLPGTVVDVTAADMGGHMHHRWGRAGAGRVSDSWRPGPMMRRDTWWAMGAMALTPSRADVPAGTVSLAVRNRGMLPHEVAVLPLPAGQPAGARAVGRDGTVDEAGLVAEAARTCGPGDGDGVSPGAAGWVTTRLAPGSYELVCNRPGHYASGMYAPLHVS